MWYKSVRWPLKIHRRSQVGNPWIYCLLQKSGNAWYDNSHEYIFSSRFYLNKYLYQHMHEYSFILSVTNSHVRRWCNFVAWNGQCVLTFTQFCIMRFSCYRSRSLSSVDRNRSVCCAKLAVLQGAGWWSSSEVQPVLCLRFLRRWRSRCRSFGL